MDNIDTRKYALVDQINKNMENQQSVNDCAKQKKIEVERIKKDFKNVTNNYNQQEKVSTALKKAKSITQSEVDKLRADQSEIVHKREPLQNRL